MLVWHFPTFMGLTAALMLMAGLVLPKRLGIVGRMARSIAKRKRLAVIVAGLFGFGIPMVISLWRGHAPNFHDEHSNLLAADTFIHGRLTNSTPPFAEHFDSYHTLVRPTYQSKYPPLPGLTFALGKWLGGDFIVGSWLSLGLLAAAGCWMMQALLPSRWALLGGLILATHPSILFFASSNWSQTYWGGGATAAAGALVYGAVGRVTRGGSPWHFAILGVGLMMLANSRPFEGLLVSLPAACVMLAWTVRSFRTEGIKRTALQLAPLALVLASGLGAMMLYFDRVTGNPLRMPYLEHEAQYAVAPSFYPLPLRPVPKQYFLDDGTANPDLAHRHGFHAVGYEMESYRMYDTAEGRWRAAGNRLLQLGRYFLLPLLPVFVGLLWLRRSRKTWLMASACLCVLAGSMFAVWTSPHYVAPFTAIVVFLAVQGLRVCVVMRPLTRVGTRILLVTALTGWVGVSCWLWVVLVQRSTPIEFEFRRQQVAQQVAAEGGKHIILVRYEPKHVWGAELVYNGADLDEPAVLWARSLGSEKDRRLRDAFPDRTVWVLDHSPGEWILSREP